MKNNIAACLLLLSISSLCSMNSPWAGKPITRSDKDSIEPHNSWQGQPITRTYGMDPNVPSSCLQPGETLEQRDARITATIALEINCVEQYLHQTNSHPFAGSPDLLAKKGISQQSPRSPRQVQIDLIAQAAKNRKEKELKK